VTLLIPSSFEYTCILSLAPAELGAPLAAADTVRAGKRALEDTNIEQVVEQAMRRVLKDQEASVSISRFSAQHWQHMRKAAGLTVQTIELPAPAVEEDPPPFQWNSDPEPRQADRYMHACASLIGSDLPQ
jgi:hypothetical protein